MKAVFPTNFLEPLAEVALVNGEEAAWLQEDCLKTIGWLAENGYAVLGFELWLPVDGGIRTAISTRTGPGIYVSSCNRKKDENWQDYVQRSAREAAEGIGTFRWFDDALEPPRPAYFNLTWTNEEWFDATIKDAKHTSDK